MISDILAKLRKLQQDSPYEPIEVAEYLKIDLATYNRMLNGKMDTWHKYITKLLDLYKMTPLEFFQDIQGKNFVYQTNSDFKDNATAQALGNVETLSFESTATAKLIKKLEESEENYKRKYYKTKEKLEVVEEKLEVAEKKILDLEQR